MRLDRFQRSALLTTISTYFLIAIGGLVRAAGAGLGCPDWPKCFDRWIPPTDVSQVPAHIDPALFNFTKAWTEYLNRLSGVLVGIFIFATLVLALKDHRKSPRVLYPTLAAFLLVGFEGWLGGQVVRSQLKPIVLTVHLTFALIIVSLLLYATFCAFFPQREKKPLSVQRKRLGMVAIAVSVVTLLQIGIGAVVRGEVQLIAEAGAARETWLNAVGLIDIVHRNFAIFTAMSVMGLGWYVFSKMEPDRWLRAFAGGSVVLVLLQGVAGVGLANLGFPRALQVAHLWLASLLLGTLTLVCLLAHRIDPRLDQR